MEKEKKINKLIINIIITFMHLFSNLILITLYLSIFINQLIFFL